jgi:ATP-binding cassette subfamily F protein 3
MAILTANNLSKAYGSEDIFEEVSLSLPQGGKAALVGPNGAGKTSLLKILLRLEAPSGGEVHLARETRIGYLPQNPSLDGEHSLHEEMLSAFAPLRRMEAALQTLEHEMGANPEALERYGRLQAEFERLGGYTYEVQIEQVLQGLGFTADFYERPLSQLSGGQKTRALLARLLLEKPDLLALDEPTNHLDIDAIEWLEGFLRAYEGTTLIISHDRYFMDSVVDTIWELDWGTLETYRGNYSAYLAQREERHERRRKEYEAQQAFIAKEQDYIARNIAGQNTAQAKGRRKRLERLFRGDDHHRQLLDAPPKRRHLALKLQAASRTGDQVLKTRGLKVGYHGRVLVSVPDLLLLRGEVAAIMGGNGAGKSTFLKTILGKLEAVAGEYTWGAGVQVGYFAQAHEDLQPENDLLDEISKVKALLPAQAREYLAQYQFTGEEVFRKVGTLSGGERGRLALAKLALSGANVLLLDEPTNHLDIPSQEILQSVLADFQGTILLVSHDRYLIEALASQIWQVGAGKMTVFMGGYADFLAERKKAQDPAAQSNGKPTALPKKQEKAKPKHGLNPYQLEKRLKETEARVHRLEAEFAELSAALEIASLNGQAEEVARLGLAYTAKEAELEAAFEEWATLSG